MRELLEEFCKVIKHVEFLLKTTISSNASRKKANSVPFFFVVQMHNADVMIREDVSVFHSFDLSHLLVTL